MWYETSTNTISYHIISSATNYSDNSCYISINITNCSSSDFEPPTWMERAWGRVPGFGRIGLRALNNVERNSQNSAVYWRKDFGPLMLSDDSKIDQFERYANVNFGITGRRL